MVIILLFKFLTIEVDLAVTSESEESFHSEELLSDEDVIEYYDDVPDNYTPEVFSHNQEDDK
jgi:hypothetical protein